ncbi:MAG: hypothetical protein QOH52_958 [Pseudonocardiales bacterium]|jgi:peptidoglycan hydrolase-like protein with peptidoglycan-binding domain|nr:hypothetical protein [Jatrophihabitans sp.]MDT4902942.1 hypothetical protein [Pseudonocardiales bacterium]
MSGEPLLRRGSDNTDWVIYLQQALAAEGYPSGADGTFGDGTEAAVRQYQQANGMQVDGIVGRQTWGGLIDHVSLPPGVPDGGGGTSSSAGGAGAGDGGAGGSGPLSVHQSVTLVAQPTETSCWAASIAMLVSETPEAVVERADMKIDEGYGWSEIEPAASKWGLTPLAPACGMPDLLAGWVHEYGPLWVVEVGAPYHAVVVGGVEGDGTPDGTFVTVYNPWPPGSGAVESITFTQFESDFELGAGSKASLLHR